MVSIPSSAFPMTSMTSKTGEPPKKMKKGLKYFAALPMPVIEEEGFGYHASNSKRSACLRQPAKTSEHARSGDP
jgi:hypothetical protein